MEDIRLKTREVFNEFSPDVGNVIPILQKVQTELGFISQLAVDEIAGFLKITTSQIYGVASFYSQFRFTPPGRHSISVCLGTACHVRGGEILLETLERDLEVKPGQCTRDGRFDLERVACLGCCALSPVIKVDDDVYSNVTVIKLNEILEKYE